jgi:hypothetical protein
MSEFIDRGDVVTVNLKNPNGRKNAVEIRRIIDEESVLIDVDNDEGKLAKRA